MNNVFKSTYILIFDQLLMFLCSNAWYYTRKRDFLANINVKHRILGHKYHVFDEKRIFILFFALHRGFKVIYESLLLREIDENIEIYHLFVLMLSKICPKR